MDKSANREVGLEHSEIRWLSDDQELRFEGSLSPTQPQEQTVLAAARSDST